MRRAAALLSASLLASSVAAFGQVVTGPYVGVNIGATPQQPESLSGTSTKVNFDFGLAGGASVGYGFGNGFRAELEGNFLNNQFSKLSHAIVTPNSVGGREEKYGALINGIYDFDVGSQIVYPYVGVGAGYEDVRWSPFRATDFNTGIEASGDKGGFAAQLIAGGAFPISYVPGLSFTAEYRFQDVVGKRSYNAERSDVTGVSYGTLEGDDTQNHEILIGFRYAFGSAPPPPAPAPAAAPPPPPAPIATPAPAPARTYLVFFDWDKSDLTDKAKSIIADAAQASTKVQTTQIEVNGYTDLSGTAKYNKGLSIRRAKAVAGELVRLGVPSSEIEIQGYGESNPLVPTASGVREPQNRRVEIILR